MWLGKMAYYMEKNKTGFLAETVYKGGCQAD